MKTIMSVVFAVSLSFGVPHAIAKVSSPPAFEQGVVEHGGGCRKNSPTGLCCHMDHKTGIVHCH